MKTSLFIGGSHDGEHIPISGFGDYVILQKQISLPKYQQQHPVVEKESVMETERYIPKKFFGDDGTRLHFTRQSQGGKYYTIFCLEGMTGADIMDKLIENYHPNGNIGK